MKNLFLLFFFFPFLNAKSQNQVTIKAKITGLKDGSKVWLVPENGDIWRDSVIVKNSSFQFQREITEPTQYSIRLTRDPENGKWQTFYIEKGILNITATDANFYNATTAGSKFAEDFNDYHSYLKSQNSNHPLIANSYSEFKRLDSAKAVWSKQWIISHLNSPISSYVLYTYLKAKISYKETEKFFNKLSFAAKETVYWKYLKSYVEAPMKIVVGKIAPSFSQRDTSAKLISLSDFKGKYVLIDFWASWCVPCRTENPNLVKAYNKYKDKKFTILSISLDNKRANWIEAIRKDSLNWTHISDLKFWDNAIVKQYSIASVPSNILLDPNGRIIAINLRGEALEHNLAKLIK